MKTVFILVSVIMVQTVVSQSTMDKVSFFEGTWKVENKEQYEVWSYSENAVLEGQAYKMKDGQKVVTETFSISMENNDVIYWATVPDQNDGATIPFTLNKNDFEVLSFENLSHDFPKKIIYQKLNDKEIKVSVLGENDKGFSYKMQKQ